MSLTLDLPFLCALVLMPLPLAAAGFVYFNETIQLDSPFLERVVQALPLCIAAIIMRGSSIFSGLELIIISVIMLPFAWLISLQFQKMTILNIKIFLYFFYIFPMTLNIISYWLPDFER